MDQILLFAQNDMYHRDLLVAAIAAVLGLRIVYAAATNDSWVFQLGSLSALERQFGRQPTRMILACVGTTLILLGIYLVAGSWNSRHENVTDQNGRPTASVPRNSTITFGTGQ